MVIGYLLVSSPGVLQIISNFYEPFKGRILHWLSPSSPSITNPTGGGGEGEGVSEEPIKRGGGSSGYRQGRGRSERRENDSVLNYNDKLLETPNDPGDSGDGELTMTNDVLPQTPNDDYDYVDYKSTTNDRLSRTSSVRLSQTSDDRADCDVATDVGGGRYEGGGGDVSLGGEGGYAGGGEDVRVTSLNIVTMR